MDEVSIPIAWAGVTIDCTDPEALSSFWGSLLGLDPRSERDGWYRIGPLVPGGPVINFQPVPEQKTDKVRTHLDLWVDDLDAAITRVEALGGRRSGQKEVIPKRGTIVVMSDPEGHEFCLISARTD